MFDPDRAGSQPETASADSQTIARSAARRREADPAFARWAAGYGRIRHTPLTQVRVEAMAETLAARGVRANLAHNLPLGANPHTDPVAARRFNASARKLWVAPAEIRAAAECFQHHEQSGRPREREHPLAMRQVRLATVPDPLFRPVTPRRDDPASWTTSSPMGAVDLGFLETVRANPHLRPRVGNPDEMRSNRMQRTLDVLRFRVTDPEPGVRAAHARRAGRARRAEISAGGCSLPERLVWGAGAPRRSPQVSANSLKSRGSGLAPRLHESHAGRRSADITFPGRHV